MNSTNKRNLFQRTAIASAFLVIGATAQAANVTYSNIADANGVPALFDPATTAPDISNVNKLVLGLDNFTVSAANGAFNQVSDTLSFKVTAPSGFKITKLTYTEGGTGVSTGAFAGSSATVSLIANGKPASPGFAGFLNLSGSWGPVTKVYDFTGAGGESIVDFSVVNTLGAFAFTGSTASITKTSASITAEIAAVPLPPAAWMLGSALVGLVTVGRRKLRV
ncbi:MAG: hypothetical protein HYX63_04640 [Gammaproteobacteria bacterium]|nr:hypothetical protein [Gammaproteobacteria bacterium]